MVTDKIYIRHLGYSSQFYLEDSRLSYFFTVQFDYTSRRVVQYQHY